MLVLKRRNIVIFLTVLASITAFFVCVGAFYKTPVIKADANSITVVLDAGHGGVDGGVSGVKTGIKESDLNLDVVMKLKGCFESAGINVVLTRNSDAGLYGVATKNRKRKDMEKRKEIIENARPNAMISVHMNNYPVSTRRGAQVFFKKGDETGKDLADEIQKSFNGMEECVKQTSALSGDYYILNCTSYPSVICECGFLSNPEDEALLSDEGYRDKIAYAIFKGAISYLSQTSAYITD